MHKFVIVVPWHKQEVYDAFVEAWMLDSIPDYLLIEKDVDRIGCARMKNKLIHKAIFDMKAEVVGVLDSDCHPVTYGLETWMNKHIKALEDQEVELFQTVTKPISRGTPYYHRTVRKPVAASMGFWDNVPDWDAPSQLVRQDERMEFKKQVIFDRYFPLSGMNMAFKANQWPWCQFIDVDRFDDIWMGFLWQKHAYENNQCFNLNAPTVWHSRQSNVWNNLKIETPNLERNETLWQDIYNAPKGYSRDGLMYHVGL